MNTKSDKMQSSVTITYPEMNVCSIFAIKIMKKIILGQSNHIYLKVLTFKESACI